MPHAEIEQRAWSKFGVECAVLVLDSVGFTRTVKKRGIVYYMTIVARMRAIAEQVMNSAGVIRWRAEADNLIAEFESMDAALHAAFDMHDRIAASGMMLDENNPYAVGVGIGYGAMLRTNHEGVYGDEMNLASKLGEDIAMPGETLVTEKAWISLRAKDRVVAEQRTVHASGMDITYFALRAR